MPFTKNDPNINRSGRPIGIKPTIKKCKEVLAEQGINPIEELIKLYNLSTTTVKEKITILVELQSYAESKPVKEIHSVVDSTNLNKDITGLTTEQLIKALDLVDNSATQIKLEAPKSNEQ